MFVPRAIAKIVDQVARQSVGKDWNIYAALLDHWPEIVGKDYAEVTTPVKITFPHQPNEPRRRGGTLTVRLPKGLAMEFTFKTEQIRQRVNDYFGSDTIGKIAFEPAYGTAAKAAAPKASADPAALAEIHQAVASVDSAELSDALRSFGEAVIGGLTRKI